MPISEGILAVTQARTECTALHQRLDDARRDFAAELDKLRDAAQLAEERFRAAEKRALLEIDRERGTVTKIQKELDAVRTAAAQAEDRQRSELARLQDQLGDLRQKSGVLEGNLHAVTAAREQALNENSTLKIRLEQITVEAATARTEANTWRERATLAEPNTKLQESAKPMRASRKTKTT